AVVHTEGHELAVRVGEAVLHQVSALITEFHRVLALDVRQRGAPVVRPLPGRALRKGSAPVHQARAVVVGRAPGGALFRDLNEVEGGTAGHRVAEIPAGVVANARFAEQTTGDR